MTRGLLPSPVLALTLFVLWILLVQSVSPANVLAGMGLALFWSAVARRLADGTARRRKPMVMTKLFLRVVGDMLRANVEVIGALLARPPSQLRSRFVPIPLDLKDPTGLSVLAMIVTFTPGTAWVELSLDKQSLLLHVLSARDEGLVVAAIKDRYERPLREIFE